MRRVTAIAVVVALIAAAAACARPGEDPGGTPTAVVSRHAYVSAAPAPMLRPTARGMPRPAAGGKCGSERTGIARPSGPPLDRSVRPDESLSEAQERQRRVLESMRKPTPQRAPVPAPALQLAESCVDVLRPELRLLGVNGALTEEELRAHLTARGLEAVRVRPPLSFAGRVGEACLYGAVTPTGPTFELGPLGTGGTCRP